MSKETKIIKNLFKSAKAKNKTIVLPEALQDKRVLKSAQILLKSKICKLIFIGESKQNFGEDVKILNPKTFEDNKILTAKLVEIRKNKGMTEAEAKKLLQNPVWFATMLVKCGYADGMVAGAINTTADVLKPAFQIIKTAPGAKIISSCFLMLGKKQTLVLADCAVNIKPTAEELADIAAGAADSAKTYLNLKPKIAMLSYSTLSKSNDEDVLKVKAATELVKKKGYSVIGEIQADAALRCEVAKIKAPKTIAGNCNVLVFPNLESGNIAYKLMQHAGNLTAIGPLLQGIDKPINDVSRGATSQEIALTVAITILSCK